MIGSFDGSREGDPVTAQVNMRERKVGLSTAETSTEEWNAPFAVSKRAGQGIPEPDKKLLNDAEYEKEESESGGP